jgi:hypothetical protein
MPHGIILDFLVLRDSGKNSRNGPAVAASPVLRHDVNRSRSAQLRIAV